MRHNAMGNWLSDPIHELQDYGRETHRRIWELDRCIAEQDALIVQARDKAVDEEDAREIAVLEDDLKKFKRERTRALAIKGKIKLAISMHRENDVIHDIRGMMQEIRSSRMHESETMDVSDVQVAEVVDQMLDDRLAQVPDLVESHTKDRVHDTRSAS